VTGTRTTRRSFGAGVLTLVATMVLCGCASLPAEPAITESDTAIPFAGDVPLVTPVIDANDKTVTFAADWDNIHGTECSLPDTRTTVEQTAKAVTITVLGYATPLRAGVACGSSGTIPIPMSVTLNAPLGARPLIDGSTGKDLHPWSDTSVPTAHTIPAGYSAKPLTWEKDPDGYRATRSWQPGAQPWKASIQLIAGVPKKFYGYVASAGTKIGTVSIDGAVANEYRYTASSQIITTIRWTTSSGRQIEIDDIGTPANHHSIAEVEAVAQTVY
jgi:hypothetical protein